MTDIVSYISICKDSFHFSFTSQFVNTLNISMCNQCIILSQLIDGSIDGWMDGCSSSFYQNEHLFFVVVFTAGIAQ